MTDKVKPPAVVTRAAWSLDHPSRLIGSSISPPMRSDQASTSPQPPEAT
jgi:hypothetical protein